MPRAKGYCWVMLELFCIVGWGWAQESSPPSAVEERALRILIEQFFATYAKKDVDGFMALWSGKSPEWAPRQQQMQQFFSGHDQIEVKSFKIGKVTVQGEKASLRIEVEMSALEEKTGQPAAGLGKSIRTIDCVQGKAAGRSGGRQMRKKCWQQH